VQLQGDYVGLWRSCYEFILILGAVTVRLFRALAQLQGDYVTVISHMFVTKLQQVITVCHCRFRNLISIQLMLDL